MLLLLLNTRGLNNISWEAQLYLAMHFTHVVEGRSAL